MFLNRYRGDCMLPERTWRGSGTLQGAPGAAPSSAKGPNRHTLTLAVSVSRSVLDRMIFGPKPHMNVSKRSPERQLRQTSNADGLVTRRLARRQTLRAIFV